MEEHIVPLLFNTPSFLAPFPLLYPLPTLFVVSGSLFVRDLEMYFEKEAAWMLNNDGTFLITNLENIDNILLQLS